MIAAQIDPRQAACSIAAFLLAITMFFGHGFLVKGSFGNFAQAWEVADLFMMGTFCLLNVLLIQRTTGITHKLRAFLSYSLAGFAGYFYLTGIGDFVSVVIE